MKLGNLDIVDCKIGSTQINKVYLGSNLVWQKASPLLLDLYPDAAAAYSLRKLRTAYAGSAIRVRRSSDNTETDIGFVDNELDTVSLLAFVGANDGFVTTWYDQSGEGNDVSQVLAGNQPKIVSSGSVILENDKPCIDFDGNDDKLITSFGLLSQPNTIFTLAKIDSTSNLKLLYDDDTGNDRNTYDSIGDAFAGSPVMKSIAWVTNTQYLHSILYNSSNSYIYRNSNLISATSTIGGQGLSGLTVGARFSGNFWDGSIQEFILYNLDESTNRTGIETNINDFYSIY